MALIVPCCFCWTIWIFWLAH